MNRSDDPKVGQSILVLRETPATSDPTSSSSSSSSFTFYGASTPGQSQLKASSLTGIIKFPAFTLLWNAWKFPVRRRTTLGDEFKNV